MASQSPQSYGTTSPLHPFHASPVLHPSTPPSFSRDISMLCLSDLALSAPSPSDHPPPLPSDEFCAPPPVPTSSTQVNPAAAAASASLPPHRSHDPSNNAKRSDPFQFGSRYLLENDDVFEFNAWDHVETDEAYKEYAETQYAAQRESPVTDFDKRRFNAQPEKWWTAFYRNNAANFFKDRKWLLQEFPLLAHLTSAQYNAPATILEVGAGAGNTIFPLLAQNRNPRLCVHACDFSPAAVDLLRAHPTYTASNPQSSPRTQTGAEAGATTLAAAAATPQASSSPSQAQPTSPPLVPAEFHANVWDLASPSNLPPNLTPSSIDCALLIFTFSALSPMQWSHAIRNLYTLLKPGGQVLFRDYGRGDLAQVRFRRGRWMEENFYVRGDGTRVYFFEKAELARIWEGAEVNREENQEMKEKEPEEPQTTTEEKASGASAPTSPAKLFEIEHIGVDRRLLVNRQRKLKMYRCWLQGVFRKPNDGNSSDDKVPASTTSAFSTSEDPTAIPAAAEKEIKKSGTLVPADEGQRTPEPGETAVQTNGDESVKPESGVNASGE